MVLESTMVCVDDSDYMRNGDFVPTRMAAMQDAVQVVCNAKTRANPENNVGLLTLASSEVLSTLTTDPNKLISKLLAVQPEGELKLMSGLRVAHLALKHRQGKNHKMRIIVFIGSPIEGLDANELVRLAKKFKKEKVNVDIVTFGDGDQALLQRFIDTLNGEEGSNSRLVVVPPGPNLTSAIMGSPILMSEDGIHMAGAGGGNYDFGIDPNDDPELALALRVSMEEQRARQEAANRNAAAETGAEQGATHEEQMLEQALAMSMAPGTSGTSDSGAPARPSAPMPSMDLSAMTEEQQIAYALQMSMQDTSYAASEANTEVKMEVEDQAVSTSEAAGVASTGSTDSGDVEMADVEQAGGVVKTEPESTEVQDTAFLEQLLEEELPDQSAAVKEEPTDEAKDKDKVKKESTSKTSAASSTTTTRSSSSSKNVGGTAGAGSSKKPAGNNSNDKKKPDPKKNNSSTTSTSTASASASASTTNTKRTNKEKDGNGSAAEKKKPPSPKKKK